MNKKKKKREPKGKKSLFTLIEFTISFTPAGATHVQDNTSDANKPSAETPP